MINEEEISRGICKTLVEILERQKKKAIQCDNYEDALILSFLGSLLRETEKSLAKTW